MNARSCFVVFVVAALGIASPVQAQVALIGALSHDRTATPGEKYDGALTVKNDTDVEQEVRIYQRDYFFTCDGKNLYGDPGEQERSNARWISFSPTSLILPPKGTAAISYVVSVPRDSGGPSLKGSYWSMLMVESIPEGSPESSIKQKGSPSPAVVQNIRYGIQIATHIASTGEKLIRFLDVKLTRGEGDERILQVDLENSGTSYMKPETTVELFGSDGKSRGRIAGANYRMYPGTSVRHLIPLGRLPAGTYKALVLVDAGGEDVFGGQYTLQF